MIDNPEYKGEWKPKRIANKAYKGKWVAPDVDNPELYAVVKDNGLVGFELWQVKAGSIFDNILVCDDPEFAKAEAEKNIVPLMTKEKEMKKKKDDEEADQRRKEDEERKAKEAVNNDDDDDDDDDEDEDEG